MNVGCIPERVINGQSGFVTDDEQKLVLIDGTKVLYKIVF